MLIQFKKDHIKSNFCRNKQMEIERNFLHVLMWYSYEKSISRKKHSTHTYVIQRSDYITTPYYPVCTVHVPEENSGKLQTVSYENRHKKKCSGLQNKSCRLNYIDENCQGLSIHSVLYFLVGERCEDSVSADYIIY